MLFCFTEEIETNFMSHIFESSSPSLFAAQSSVSELVLTASVDSICSSSPFLINLPFMRGRLSALIFLSWYRTCFVYIRLAFFSRYLRRHSCLWKSILDGYKPTQKYQLSAQYGTSYQLDLGSDKALCAVSASIK